MIDPKLILHGSPANWKKIVYALLERVLQALVICWVMIGAATSMAMVYLAIRLLWVILKAMESAL